jgi:NTP pyrophosphatase (non-canonical NTP hydrolase)
MEEIIGKVYVRVQQPWVEVIPTKITKNKNGYEYVECTLDNSLGHIRTDAFHNNYMLKTEYLLKNFERKRNIINWAEDKGLVKYDNRFVQLAKLMEELGELAKAMIKDNQFQIQDGLGDCRITLSILSEQLGYDIDFCEDIAYNVIKNRKGKMVGGSFIKEEDL